MSHLSDIARGIGEKRQLRQRIAELETENKHWRGEYETVGKLYSLALKAAENQGSRIAELEKENKRLRDGGALEQ